MLARPRRSRFLFHATDSGRIEDQQPGPQAFQDIAQFGQVGSKVEADRFKRRELTLRPERVDASVEFVLAVLTVDENDSALGGRLWLLLVVACDVGGDAQGEQAFSLALPSRHGSETTCHDERRGYPVDRRGLFVEHPRDVEPAQLGPAHRPFARSSSAIT